MNKTLWWSFIVIALGVTVLANSQGYAPVDWLGIVVFLAGIALAIYGAVLSEKAKLLPAGQPSQPKAVDRVAVRPSLPPKDFEPVASVTERTTKLLEIENTKPSK